MADDLSLMRGLWDAPEAAEGLTPEEIVEAQNRGILPSPARKVTAAVLPRSVEAASASQAVGYGSTPSAPSGVASRPVSAVSRAGPAVIPRVALDPVAAPQTPLSQSIAARREQFTKQMEELNKPADYTELRRQMAARQGRSADDMYASVLAGLGPEAVRGMQAPILKQSMEARSPMKIEGGVIDAEGNVMLDPAFQRNKQIEQLRGRLAQLDTLEARAATDAEKAALAHERNQTMLLITGIAAAARQGAGQGKAATWGFTPQGQRIIEDQQGNQFVIGPGGERQPYTGTGTPKTSFEKQATSVQTLLGNVARSDALIKQVEANPSAFGIGAAALSHLPAFVQGRLAANIVSPKDMALRTEVLRQAAQEIHDIYGAALTLGEGKRAQAWALDKDDSPQVVINKLKGAKDWAQQNLTQYGPGAGGAAQARVTPGGAPPAPGGGAPALPAGWGVKEKLGG